MIIESIIGVTKSQYVSLKLKYWVFKVKEEEMNNEKKNKYRQIRILPHMRRQRSVK